MLLIQNELINASEVNNSEAKKLLELAERKSLKYCNSLYLEFFNQFYTRTNCKIDHFFDINFGDSLIEVKQKLRVIYSIIAVRSFLDVLCYKIRIGEHRIEVELHFYKNKLVFFKYAFPFIKDRTDIISHLNQKYFMNMNHIDFIDEGAVDLDDNFVRVCEKEVFTVMYLSRESRFLEYLSQLENFDMCAKKKIKKHIAG
ncbi:hypothetical protein [Tenacibaculum xiamenense]|uniref:hypothetical protein n=1 Tax=Tenacibaculum xiamenense TaxID=1261553 RepID=UPI0038946278